MTYLARAGLLLGIGVIFGSATACTSKSTGKGNSSSGGTSSGGSAGASSGGTSGTGTGGASGGAAGADAGTGGSSGSAGSAGAGCGLGPDAGAIGKWPDSKTKFCAGAGCTGGQDGSYEFNVPTYAVNGNVVTDSVTGLKWQMTAAPDLDWADAVAHCATLGKDWRLPTRLELISLADYGSNDSNNVYLPGAFTPAIGSASYWASTENFGDKTNAWYFSFSYGTASPAWAKSGPLAKLSARCVNGPTLSAAPFVENQSCDVVSSPSTGLMWQRTPDSALRDWPGALAYCEDLKHAGFDDWRLPNEKELSTIVDDKKAAPTIDTAFSSTAKDLFWSSTPNRKQPDEARFVNFSDGGHLSVISASLKMVGVNAAVRCVRNL